MGAHIGHIGVAGGANGSYSSGWFRVGDFVRMQDTPPSLRRLAARRRLMRGVLLFEAVWRGVWPALVLAGAWLTLGLLDVLPALGGWLHAALLLAVGVALLALLAAGLWRVRWPDDAAVDRRLEQRSGLRHRPLSVADDRPASDRPEGADPLAAALWRAHRQRTLARIGGLRVGLPQPGVAARDRRALRFAVLLCVLAALAVANVNAPGRLMAALNPVLPVSAATPATEVQAWITPPAYTGLAPLFLHRGQTVAPIPAGSHLTVNVSGSLAPPLLTLGGQAIGARALAGGSFQADADLRQGGVLTVRDDGAVLGAWPLSVVADQPPRAAWGPDPGAKEAEQRVRLPWVVADDYGVTALRAELRLADRPDAPALTVPIPLPGGAPKAAHGVAQADLTAHPWAGLPVVARLVAGDAAQQTGQSGAIVFRLPERPFHNPVARALIAARRTLSVRPDDRTPALAILDRLMQMPQAFAHNPAGFAELASIYYDLVRNHDAGAIDEVQDWMWRLALSEEEGLASQTARALEAARQRVQEAMQQMQHQPNEANQQALLSRLEELRDAINRHMQALVQQLQARGDALPPDRQMMELSNKDLDRMADAAEQAVKQGRLDQAQQEMAQLEKLLDRLRSARPAADGQQGARQRRGMNQTNAVQEMIAREGSLLDRAQQRGEAGSAAADPARQREADARVQQALRRGLGELMQEFADLTGAVSPNLGAADQAMAAARTALAQGDDAAAGAAQQGAIAALQKGRQDMREALAKMPGGARQAGGADDGADGEDGMGLAAGRAGWGSGRFGTMPGTGDEADAGDRDPLGRQTTGHGAAAGDVTLPSGQERSRSQAISEELRRRDADRQRSQEERDYIGRLLKQF